MCLKIGNHSEQGSDGPCSLATYGSQTLAIAGKGKHIP